MKIAFFISISAITSGCATVHSLSDNDDLPVGEIVTDAVCRVRHAFIAEEMPYGFQRDSWAVNIQLLPKNTIDIAAGIGGSYFSNPANTALLPISTFALASIGGLPAAGFSTTASTEGKVYYTIHTSKFRDRTFEKEFIKACSQPHTYQYDVTSNLDVGNWIRRFSTPLEGKLLELSDKGDGNSAFQYIANLTVQYGAGLDGRYTTRNARFTGDAGVGAQRKQDITLILSFVSAPIKTSRGRTAAISKETATALQNLTLGSSLQRLNLR